MKRRIAALLVSVHLVLMMGAAQSAQSAPAQPPRVFCLSREGWLEAKAAIARDEPRMRASWQRLLREANQALDVGPFSVMLKSPVPPSGDKHDYLSISPYDWPDPGQPDGLPYQTRDGFTNPEWWQDYDRVPLERLTQATETLALAYSIGGRELYARRAAHLLRVWFLDAATAMNPDLVYAQGIPGRNTGETQVIDTRFLPRVIDAIGLLHGSSAWSAQDQAGMVAWFRRFLANIRRRADAEYRASPHNIASFYHVQTAAMALFIGDEALAREMIERTKSRLAKAVEADGYFFRERRKTRSLSYSAFHLYAIFNLATMAPLVGVDLWNFATDDGRGLRRALDRVAPHAGPSPAPEWPFQETGRTPGDWWDPFHDQRPVVLHHAARAYEEPRYEEQAAKILAAADGVDAHRLYLMCGLPLPGQQSLSGWLFHPSHVE